MSAESTGFKFTAEASQQNLTSSTRRSQTNNNTLIKNVLSNSGRNSDDTELHEGHKNTIKKSNTIDRDTHKNKSGRVRNDFQGDSLHGRMDGVEVVSATTTNETTKNGLTRGKTVETDVNIITWRAQKVRNKINTGYKVKKEDEEEEEDDINPRVALAVVVALHAMILLPLLLYYTPTGYNGVFFYYYDRFVYYLCKLILFYYYYSIISIFVITTTGFCIICVNSLNVLL